MIISCVRVPWFKCKLCFQYSFLFMHIVGGSGWWLKYFGLVYPCGRLGLKFWPLVIPWSSPGYWRGLGVNQWMEDFFLALLFCFSKSKQTMMWRWWSQCTSCCHGKDCKGYNWKVQWDVMAGFEKWCWLSQMMYLNLESEQKATRLGHKYRVL